MAIFHHQDGDEPNVDYLSVTDERTYLLFDGQGPGDGLGDVSTRVRMDRDAALRLHAALGEWLYPVHTPEGPNRSLIEQMIERNVREQITAILPVHLAPVAAVEDPLFAPGSRDYYKAVLGIQDDPEPGDVGHPRPHGPAGFACTCHDSDGNSVLPEPGEHGRLMAELPRRTRPKSPGPCDERPPVGARIAAVHDCGYIWGAHKAPEAFIPKCPDCGHGWMEHYSSMCWGGGAGAHAEGGCRCTQVRPAPVPEYCGRCTHSWTRHGVGAGNCNVRIPGGECGCEAIRP